MGSSCDAQPDARAQGECGTMTTVHASPGRTMAEINVVADAAGARWADALVALLLAGGHRVSRVTLAAYPIGDALPFLLHRYQSEAAFAIAIIGITSRNANWISAELRLANLYPRILLALEPQTKVPRGWSPRDPRLLLPGDEPSLRVMWLASGRAVPPPRGDVVALCDHCAQFIPAMDLAAPEIARIRGLGLTLARAELIAATGCTEAAAGLWVEHAGVAMAVRPGPPCPFCGASLPTTRSRQCLRCSADWHHLDAIDGPAAQPAAHELPASER
jgi:hypothetical protein